MGGKSFGLPGTGELRGSSSFVDGATQVSVYLTGVNGFEGIADLGTIEVVANLVIAADGTVTVMPGSVAKEFPSVEGFAYTISDGKLVIQQLFTATETEKEALKRRRYRRLDNACTEASYLPSCG